MSSDPEIGDLMVGTGGCRTVRIAGRGKGKSGGYRLITFYRARSGRVFLLSVFSKGQRANLSKAERNALASIVRSCERQPKLYSSPCGAKETSYVENGV